MNLMSLATRIGVAVLPLSMTLACASSGTPTGAGAERVDDPRIEGEHLSRNAPEVRRSDRELRRIYFDYDAYTLREDARETLQHNAGLLRDRNVAVQIEGHCDERGSAEYNMALGKKRADAAKQYLVDLGIEPSRITTLSYGEENPAVAGRNEVAWAQNRRGDFRFR